MTSPRTRFVWFRTGMLLALALTLLAAACAGPGEPATSHGGPVTDQPSLIDNLRAQGLTVNPVDQLQQPFLSGSGNTVSVNGHVIQVFEYENAELARQDAARIQPNGTVPGAQVTWPAQPHFYQKERIIVIYPGTDQAVLSALEQALGKPFAVGP